MFPSHYYLDFSLFLIIIVVFLTILIRLFIFIIYLVKSQFKEYRCYIINLLQISQVYDLALMLSFMQYILLGILDMYYSIRFHLLSCLLRVFALFLMICSISYLCSSINIISDCLESKISVSSNISTFEECVIESLNLRLRFYIYN